MQINSLKNDDVIRLLNIVYSMFFAVLARFSVEQTKSPDGVIGINFLITTSNICMVLSLYIYFAFDWLTTNFTVQTKTGTGAHRLLPILVLFILALGGLVAFSFQPTAHWVFYFGIYAVVVPFYDLISTPSHGMASAKRIIVWIIISLRCAVGMFIVIQSGFFLYLQPEGIVDGTNLSFDYLIILYVALKVGRYYIILPIMTDDVPSLKHDI